MSSGLKGVHNKMTKFGEITLQVKIESSLYDSCTDEQLEPYCEKLSELEDAVEAFAQAWLQQNAPYLSAKAVSQ